MPSDKKNPAGQGGIKSKLSIVPYEANHSTARSLLQAKRSDIEFLLKRTTHADLLRDEAQEAVVLFCGIGIALQQFIEESEESMRDVEDGAPGVLGKIGGAA